MKSDHRHELKTNELADWIAHLPEWARENRTSLIAAAAVVLVALVVYFWSFYRKDVAFGRNQQVLTRLITEDLPQQINRVARAATQGQDESYLLLQPQKSLQEFAAKASHNDMAALALIQRGGALRAELHYRLADVGRDDLIKQIGQAQASYQQALDRKPSSPSLVATARYGLGLCEEELGNFDKAREIYQEVAEKPEYAGTTAQAAAAYRLTVMKDYQTEVVFLPAPPTPVEPPVSTLQIQPGAAPAPMIGPLPAPEMDAESAAPAPQAPTPVPDAAPGAPDTNAPQDG